MALNNAKNNEKIAVLTGGGTAGHCLPALAVGDELKKRGFTCVYVGSENGVEKKLAGEKGLEYHAVPCAKLERRPTLKNLTVPVTLLRGIAAAEKTLEQIRPAVVFSKGGYVSLPVVIAAKRLNIPVALHESDLTLGLANKISLKYATVLFTGFKDTALEYPKAIFTGNPLRRELSAARDKSAIRKKYGFTEDKKVLFAFGGSQGAGTINELVRKNLDELLKTFYVLHACGRGKLADVKKDGYIQTEYVSDMGEVYAISDVIVTRAGANALAEIVAMKIPALAIPLPKKNSRGDQIDNAKYYNKKGAINVLYEENITSQSFLSSVYETLKHGDNLKSNCKKCIPGDPAAAIADKLVEISLQT